MPWWSLVIAFGLGAFIGSRYAYGNCTREVKYAVEMNEEMKT